MAGYTGDEDISVQDRARNRAVHVAHGYGRSLYALPDGDGVPGPSEKSVGKHDGISAYVANAIDEAVPRKVWLSRKNRRDFPDRRLYRDPAVSSLVLRMEADQGEFWAECRRHFRKNRWP